MISRKSLDKEWIMGIREKSQFPIDPILIEKMILALILLENLQSIGVDFTFKGGTSLLLVLGKLRRFSIDVDIIVKSNQEIKNILQAVIQQGIFHRFEEDQRSSNVPKSHYKFFFKSAIEKKESSILLDILFEDIPYPVYQIITIESDLIINEGESVNIKCLTQECLLGDKLTAFAPHTTGILYGKDKDLEIIKQLYDIGLLFDGVSDVSLVKETFHIVVTKELAYRGQNLHSINDVLNDTFNTACQIGMHRFNFNTENAGLDKENTELKNGIKKLSGFVFGERFTSDTAILCASKTAYLVRLLQKGEQEILRFDSSIDLSKLEINYPHYNKLNKVKKISPEAFYYFYKAIE